MANFEGKTTSNGAKIKKSKKDELQNYINQFDFECGSMGELVYCQITAYDELEIWGDNFLSINKNEKSLVEGIDYCEHRRQDDHGCIDCGNQLSNKETVLEEGTESIDEFLKGLVPFLEEELVIQCIGAEKCRFPFSAWEVKVEPNGKITERNFKFSD